MRNHEISKLKNEIVEVGEQLLTYINYIEVCSKRKEVISSSIFSGTSGMILFLLDLYKLTNNSKYIEASIRLGQINIEQYKTKKVKTITFYKGDLGNSFTLLQLYKISECKLFYEKAFNILKECKEPKNKSLQDFSLFRGIAGNIVVLLHFLSMKQENWIIEYLEKNIQELLYGMIKKDKGICWSEFEKNIRFPINMAFGTSGIDYAFCELFALSKNRRFWEIHKEIIDYEDSNWNRRLKNWPDYRKDIKNANDYRNHKEAYNSRNYSFFTKPQDSLSWAYGASGVGMSRLRVTNSTNRDVREIISTTVDKISLSYNKLDLINLFEGLSGVIIFLLEANKHVQTLDLAEKVLLYSLNKNENCKDQSSKFNLFEGQLGVYYSSLQYLLKVNGITSINILNPYIENKESHLNELKLTCRKFDQAFINSCAISKQYPITYKILQKIEIEKSQTNSKRCNKNLRKKLLCSNNELSQLVTQCDKKHVDIVRDSYSYEKKILEKINSIKSNALVKIASLVNKENKDLLLGLDYEKFKRQLICRSPFISIHKTTYNWKDFETKYPNFENKEFALSFEVFEGIKMHTERMLIITKPVDHVDLVEPVSINRIEYLIINIFRKPIRIIDGLSLFWDNFDIDDNKSKSKLKRIYFKYVKELIRQEILISAQTTISKKNIYCN